MIFALIFSGLASALAIAKCCGSHQRVFGFRIDVAGKVWEVDEFLGDNKGLLVAEIELESEDEKFILPPWVTTEVTGDAKYYNSNLSATPFCKW